MSNIPVAVLGIKRMGEKAKATQKHLKKIGFKNVSIYWGEDIKNNPTYISNSGEKRKIKLNQITMYNSFELLRKNRNLKELIYAEDDVRITKPEELFKHLKRGIKGINRLVYLDLKVSKYDKNRFLNPYYPYGTQMIGFSNKAINNLADFNKYYNYDIGLNINFKQNIGKNYGFEYVYSKGDKPIHEHATQKQKEQTEEFDKKHPIAHRRYQ